jgi:hypothetical protein
MVVVTWEAVQRMILSFPTKQERAAAVVDFNALISTNLGQYPHLGRPARPE